MHILENATDIKKYNKSVLNDNLLDSRHQSVTRRNVHVIKQSELLSKLDGAEHACTNDIWWRARRGTSLSKVLGNVASKRRQ